ncbi:hypothetical protein DMB66_21820 [Actinoplanes sp. ATCC 53533]|uniref:hypothetical protein n=1 Tax=Actinoplanes sp. ATCC 53533 TaxID=1288362 RepID=UPI000F77CDF1|nr:hypothetical protein [Actinoplanes sp. ATCC 53533]RSM63971.1 hypothetical protein DMB66_21820 [Actinoplanes sp. ATCC 53533]
MAAALLMVAIVAGFASPAQADDPPPWGARYEDAYYYGSIDASRSSTILLSESCAAGCYEYARWHTIGAGLSPSEKPIIKLKSYLTNQCISSGGSTAGETAWTKPCASNYENWELFKVPDSGGTYFVFKSWGAWVNQGLHLCLQANGNPAYVRMQPCNTANNRQRWR